MRTIICKRESRNVGGTSVASKSLLFLRANQFWPASLLPYSASCAPVTLRLEQPFRYRVKSAGARALAVRERTPEIGVPRVPPQPIEISTAYTRSPNPNQGSDRLQESYIFPRRQTHIQKPTVDPESSGPRIVVICVVSAAAAVVSICLRMYSTPVWSFLVLRDGRTASR